MRFPDPRIAINIVGGPREIETHDSILNDSSQGANEDQIRLREPELMAALSFFRYIAQGEKIIFLQMLISVERRPYRNGRPRSMFVMISIHRPNPVKEKLLIDSMHRYGDAAKSQKGLVSVHTLKDEETGQLFGLAIWDSQESFMEARPALRKATEGDDFDSWEQEPVMGHRLKSV